MQKGLIEMSADNGIYILQTESQNGGDEFRVAHLQAIDNISWDEDLGLHTDNLDKQIKNARDMFQGAEIFKTEDQAFQKARDLAKEIDEDGGYLEYGISSILIPRVF